MRTILLQLPDEDTADRMEAALAKIGIVFVKVDTITNKTFQLANIPEFLKLESHKHD